ncbi:MAG: ABC transporter ATP-binding protein [Verrucomicrobia bacterium]|nr:ABC transporter ATP-binding protein [Verrucomicrobiota bacterium]
MLGTLFRIFRHTLRFPMRSALSLLMAIVCTSLVLVLPGVTMQFVDVVIKQHRPDLILPTVAVGVAAIFCRQFLFTLRTYFNNALELKLTHLIRVELYDKLQRLPVRWFDSNSSGEIMSRVAEDVPTMDRVLIEGTDTALASVLQFLIIVGYMLWHSWELTLVTLAPLPFIGILTAWWSRKAEPKWRESSEASSALNAVLHDNLAGIRQIKAYTVEPKALEDFEQASQKLGEKHLDVMKGQAIVWPTVSLIAESGIILMVAFGAAWTLQGKITEGTTLAFLVAWGFLFDPISRINSLAQTFTRGIVSAERVFRILDTLEESHLIEGIRPEAMRGHIRFENVSFSYGEEAPAVSDLTLEAKPGETVALVGATGAGKSTVLNLLTRFYEPSSGRILVDGAPLAEISKEWLRDQTGFVTQESFLFNTTIRENLQVAKPDATDDEIWAALEAANAAAFVRAAADGLDTVAGERGLRFSGGEKQRISIARALLKNPPLLLLDEATSALDNRTERLVQEALERLRADRTCFVIAHRLSTVRKAHRICVLDRGTLIEQGTHDELLAMGGAYARLCEGSLGNSSRQAPGPHGTAS